MWGSHGEDAIPKGAGLTRQRKGSVQGREDSSRVQILDSRPGDSNSLPLLKAAPGTRVCRGPDWDYCGDHDGGLGQEGYVTEVEPIKGTDQGDQGRKNRRLPMEDGFLWIVWDCNNQIAQRYRFGVNGKIDVQLAPEGENMVDNSWIRTFDRRWCHAREQELASVVQLNNTIPKAEHVVSLADDRASAIIAPYTSYIPGQEPDVEIGGEKSVKRYPHEIDVSCAVKQLKVHKQKLADKLSMLQFKANPEHEGLDRIVDIYDPKWHKAKNAADAKEKIRTKKQDLKRALTKKLESNRKAYAREMLKLHGKPGSKQWEEYRNEKGLSEDDAEEIEILGDEYSHWDFVRAVGSRIFLAILVAGIVVSLVMLAQLVESFEDRRQTIEDLDNLRETTVPTYRGSDYCTNHSLGLPVCASFLRSTFSTSTTNVSCSQMSFQSPECGEPDNLGYDGYIVCSECGSCTDDYVAYTRDLSPICCDGCRYGAMDSCWNCSDPSPFEAFRAKQNPGSLNCCPSRIATIADALDASLIFIVVNLLIAVYQILEKAYYIFYFKPERQAQADADFRKDIDNRTIYYAEEPALCASLQSLKHTWEVVPTAANPVQRAIRAILVFFCGEPKEYRTNIVVTKNGKISSLIHQELELVSGRPGKKAIFGFFLSFAQLVYTEVIGSDGERSKDLSCYTCSDYLFPTAVDEVNGVITESKILLRVLVACSVLALSFLIVVMVSRPDPGRPSPQEVIVEAIGLAPPILLESRVLAPQKVEHMPQFNEPEGKDSLDGIVDLAPFFANKKADSDEDKIDRDKRLKVIKDDIKLKGFKILNDIVQPTKYLKGGDALHVAPFLGCSLKHDLLIIPRDGLGDGKVIYTPYKPKKSLPESQRFAWLQNGLELRYALQKPENSDAFFDIDERTGRVTMKADIPPRGGTREFFLTILVGWESYKDRLNSAADRHFYDWAETTIDLQKKSDQGENQDQDSKSKSDQGENQDQDSKSSKLTDALLKALKGAHRPRHHQNSEHGHTPLRDKLRLKDLISYLHSPVKRYTELYENYHLSESDINGLNEFIPILPTLNDNPAELKVLVKVLDEAEKPKRKFEFNFISPQDAVEVDEMVKVGTVVFQAVATVQPRVHESITYALDSALGMPDAADNHRFSCSEHGEVCIQEVPVHRYQARYSICITATASIESQKYKRSTIFVVQVKEADTIFQSGQACEPLQESHNRNLVVYTAAVKPISNYQENVVYTLGDDPTMKRDKKLYPLINNKLFRVDPRDGQVTLLARPQYPLMKKIAFTVQATVGLPGRKDAILKGAGGSPLSHDVSKVHFRTVTLDVLPKPPIFAEPIGESIKLNICEKKWAVNTKPLVLFKIKMKDPLHSQVRALNDVERNSDLVCKLFAITADDENRVDYLQTKIWGNRSIIPELTRTEYTIFLVSEHNNLVHQNSDDPLSKLVWDRNGPTKVGDGDHAHTLSSQKKFRIFIDCVDRPVFTSETSVTLTENVESGDIVYQALAVPQQKDSKKRKKLGMIEYFLADADAGEDIWAANADKINDNDNFDFRIDRKNGNIYSRTEIDASVKERFTIIIHAKHTNVDYRIEHKVELCNKIKEKLKPETVMLDPEDDFAGPVYQPDWAPLGSLFTLDKECSSKDLDIDSRSGALTFRISPSTRVLGSWRRSEYSVVIVATQTTADGAPTKVRRQVDLYMQTLPTVSITGSFDDGFCLTPSRPGLPIQYRWVGDDGEVISSGMCCSNRRLFPFIVRSQQLLLAARAQSTDGQHEKKWGKAASMSIFAGVKPVSLLRHENRISVKSSENTEVIKYVWSAHRGYERFPLQVCSVGEEIEMPNLDNFFSPVLKLSVWAYVSNPSHCGPSEANRVLKEGETEQPPHDYSSLPPLLPSVETSLIVPLDDTPPPKITGDIAESNGYLISLSLARVDFGAWANRSARDMKKNRRDPAKFFYSVGGSNEVEYTGPFFIDAAESVLVEAWAQRPGCARSEVASKNLNGRARRRPDALTDNGYLSIVVGDDDEDEEVLGFGDLAGDEE